MGLEYLLHDYWRRPTLWKCWVDKGPLSIEATNSRTVGLAFLGLKVGYLDLKEVYRILPMDAAPQTW